MLYFIIVLHDTIVWELLARLVGQIRETSEYIWVLLTHERRAKPCRK